MKAAQKRIKRVVKYNQQRNHHANHPAEKKDNVTEKKKKRGSLFSRRFSRNKPIAGTTQTETTKEQDNFKDIDYEMTVIESCDDDDGAECEIEGLSLINKTEAMEALSLSQTATTNVLLSISAAGIKSARFGREAMPADVFYEIEDQAGDVLARSPVIESSPNPRWSPLEFELLQGNDCGNLSLVIYEYDSSRRQCLEVACIETNLDDLQAAMKAHKRNRNKPSYLLGSSGMQVSICDVTVDRPTKDQPCFSFSWRFCSTKPCA